jgi:hypothetical protein
MGFTKIFAKTIFKPGTLHVGLGPLRSQAALSFASGTLTLDASTADQFVVSLGANVGTLAITNGTVGQEITIQFKQDATGSRTMTWPSNVKLAGAAFVLTTTASKTDTIVLLFDGTNWREKSRSLSS